MLNRSLLRGKVLQQMYALKQNESANYEQVLEDIKEKFAPVNIKDETQTREMFLEYQNEAVLEVETFFYKHLDPKKTHLHKDVTLAVYNSVSDIRQFSKNERDNIAIKLENITEMIFDAYLLTLQLVVDIAKTQQVDKRANKFGYQLIKNPFVKILSEADNLRFNLNKRNLTWDNDRDLVEGVYELSIKKDDEIFPKVVFEEITLEQHHAILLELIKKHVIKNKMVDDYFGSMIITWQEDFFAVRDMSLKTIKKMLEDQTQVVLSELSKNWEDDKGFMKVLYNRAVSNIFEYEKMISDIVTNWDIERLVSTDRIILVMAIAEMINFNNIPTKVSINEYIELSKKYSSNKSNQIINGVLDKVSQDLIANGTIKKSGRGLMDNK